MSFLQRDVAGNRITNLVDENGSHGAEGAHLLVQSASDPMDEVRTTLAQLTARAQKLANDGVDNCIVCNGHSLYEVSKKRAEDSVLLAKRATAGGAYGSPQSSVDLFMSRHLKLDMREQRRLLHQLQATQSQLASDITSASVAIPTMARPPLGGASDSIVRRGDGNMMNGNDVDIFLEDVKNGILAQTQNALHQRVRAQVLHQEDAIFRSMWGPYCVGLADDAEMLVMRGADPPNATLLPRGKSDIAAAEVSAASAESAWGAGANRSLSQLLGSRSPLAAEMKRKIAAFASIVERYPPAQWISLFSDYVADHAREPGSDAIAFLWHTVEQILEPVQRQGSSANNLSYITASQKVMERKTLTRLLTSAMRIDPSRMDELANMHAARVLEMVERQSGTSNSWVHIFQALRMGRIDVAVEACRRIRIQSLEAALQRLERAAAIERHNLPPLLDLRDLYAEAQTADDIHRHTVLFLLLQGSTGESHEMLQRVLLDLCSKVSQSLEDALWIRLFCVRTVELPLGSENPVQSLSFMQRVLLDDLQELLSMAQNDVARVASFLFHALLPATGLRLLLENSAASYIDGFHLALCFNGCDMLRCSSQETPLDLSTHIQRYAALVLLDASHQQLSRTADLLPGVATFSYFHKMGFDEAFTEFCVKNSIAVQLFGSMGSFDGEDGLLLGCNPAIPSNELLKAMANIAELAAGRNNTPLAVHLLLIQAHYAMMGDKAGMTCKALQQAVQLVCPAMAQAFFLFPRTSYVAALFDQAMQLRAALRSNDVAELVYRERDEMPSVADTHTLEVLCTMAAMCQAEANGYIEQALGIFFELPFVPKSAVQDMELCVQELCASSSSIIAAATAVLPLAFRVANNLLQLYTQQSSNIRNNRVGGGSGVAKNAGSSNAASRLSLTSPEWSSLSPELQKVHQIRQSMKIVSEWVRRCRSHSLNGSVVYEACVGHLGEFEQSHLI